MLLHINFCDNCVNERGIAKEWMELYQLVALIVVECRIRFPFLFCVYTDFINFNYNICAKFIHTFSKLLGLPIKCSPYERYTFEGGNIIYSIGLLFITLGHLYLDLSGAWCLF